MDGRHARRGEPLLARMGTVSRIYGHCTRRHTACICKERHMEYRQYAKRRSYRFLLRGNRRDRRHGSVYLLQGFRSRLACGCPRRYRFRHTDGCRSKSKSRYPRDRQRRHTRDSGYHPDCRKHGSEPRRPHKGKQSGGKLRYRNHSRIRRRI